MLLEPSLHRLTRKFSENEGLSLRLSLWDGRHIDLHPDPCVTLSLSGPGSLRYLRHPDFYTLGKAFVEGKIGIEGPVREIMRVAEALVRGNKDLPVHHLWRPRFHNRRRDALAIQYHYDVSNDFFGLWLDRNMAYSCAYFKTGREDIHTAQEQKLDHICRKLMLKPGEHFLDIGCGWGSLIRWAARHYGAEATGITLSPRQYDYASARIKEDGLEDRCRVQLCDYRDFPGEGTYDKIASVGMFEHVGLKNLSLYFGTAQRLLKEGGLMLNHGITTVDISNGAVAYGGAEFIDRYVFPLGELPHLSLVIREMSGQNLEVVDVESLRPHYAQTLLHWVTRLEANRDQAIRLAGDRRFRIWWLYLAGCAHVFERGWISVYQVLAGKKALAGLSPMPWTREYMYFTQTTPDLASLRIPEAGQRGH